MCKEIVEQLIKQEEMLQFEHFTNEDAWALGNVIVDEARKNNFSAAVRIRLNNGYTVFQYGLDGTGLDHENWMVRKENTVKVKAMSSLRAYATLKANDITLADWFLDPMEYSTCGGSFPIFVKGVGIIGTITVSGIAVVTDHDIIIEGLCQYLNKPDVPRVQEDF